MRAAIFFATREGQTRKIAEHIAQALRAHAVGSDIRDTKDVRPPVEWSKYTMAWIVASVHAGHHEAEMVKFVRQYRDDLERLNAVFLSVTLSEAGAENLQAPPERREQSARDAQRMIDGFLKDTGWHPSRSLPVAGALAYTRYNWLVRWLMKRIARTQGAPTDTSRDHEFTQWPVLDRFVNDVVEEAAAHHA